MAGNYYRQKEYGPAPLRRWIWRAFLFSILFHLLLGWVFLQAKVERFGDPYYETLVPRSFRVDRVEIDPALLDDREETPVDEAELRPENEVVEVPIEPDRVEADFQEDEIRATPLAPEVDLDRFQEEILPDPTAPTTTLEELEMAAAQSLLNELDGLGEQLFEEPPLSEARPLLEIPAVTAEQEPVELPGSGIRDLQGELGAAAGPPPGFSDLDELLARSEPLRGETEPILMPTDLLFDYDSFELRSQARESLRKLGRLIRENPRSRFVIEGHTDSFGPADYNQELSELRALAVKEWLVREAEIPPERIETVGYGQTRLIVPEGSIEEQQINRRVEIVIRTPRG